MAQEQQYSPVSFEGIVPQLDVGDPSSAFLESVKMVGAGMRENYEVARQAMRDNQKVERENQERQMKELEALAGLAPKAGETYTKFSNQRTK